MPRLIRYCPTGVPQHIIQRGNNRQNCFAIDDDYANYAHWLQMYSEEFGVDIHAWVFMTNHVHLLVTPNTDDAISVMMQSLGRRYVRYFNRSQRRTGTLWEGRFRSCFVDAEEYLFRLYRYIELNPVRAGLVENPDEYHWSSYHANANQRRSKLCTPHSEYRCLGKSAEERAQRYKAMFEEQLDENDLKEIRSSISKSLAYGSNAFKQKLERLYGRRVKEGNRGRCMDMG